MHRDCTHSAPPRLRQRLAVAASALLLAFGPVLSACSPDVHTRGNLAKPAALDSIKIGESSRAQVVSALGTPSTTSLFDDQETWFYIGAQTQQFAVWPTEELSRQVVAIRFNDAGAVDSVRLLDKDDGSELSIVDRTTPTVGQEMSIIQQLLGNIGRFSGEE